jgi:8-oxo-dGTP pyrophosphatase MutT (NUDIX family)
MIASVMAPDRGRGGAAPAVISEKGRPFACNPAAVLVFIVNQDEQILLLAHPARGGRWEVVNGAVEAGETVLEAVLRETREEAGRDLAVRPLGTVHVYTYHYDSNVPTMISIAYLLAYEGGEVKPGDDMQGSAYRWWSLDAVERERPELLVPHQQPWLLDRAIEVYRLWRDRPLPEMSGSERH